MGHVLVMLNLYETYNGSRNFYHIVEVFQGPRISNELLRGVYRDEDIARVEFKNITDKIENVIPRKRIMAV